jgi:uncharacterized protein YoxC
MKISTKLSAGFLAVGLLTMGTAAIGVLAQGRLLERTGAITDVTVSASDQGQQLSRLRQLVSTTTRAGDSDQIQSLSNELTQLKASWPSPSAEPVIDLAIDSLAKLRLDQLQGESALTNDSDSLEKALEQLLGDTNTLVEDLNFDMLINVATAVEEVNEKLANSQKSVESATSDLSATTFEGLETIKAAQGWSDGAHGPGPLARP